MRNKSKEEDEVMGREGEASADAPRLSSSRKTQQPVKKAKAKPPRTKLNRG
jgi:hypothetical protein